VKIGIGRRLVPISTFAFGLLLVAIVVALALFAFGAYADHLRRDADTLLSQSAAIARDLPADAGALDAGRRTASSALQPALLAIFSDGEQRVTVVPGHDGIAPVLVIRGRDDRREPEAHGIVARLTLGLATAFGLQTLRTHAGKLDINVQTNEPRFVADVRSFFPALAIALVAAFSIAIGAARVLTRSATQPLYDVTSALTRLSEGDFKREVIAIDGSGQLEQLARAYNGAVEQVERAFAERTRANEVMRQFIADGSHELRTPLTVIRGFVGILRSEIDGLERDEVEHILASMAQQTNVMGALIDKLILLDRWAGGTPASERIVDVVRLADEVVGPLALAHPNRAIRIAAEPKAFVRADEDDVRHALANVIDNALKYSAAEIDVTIDATERYVDVAIADRGPGMTPEGVARAFDRFFRGERRDVEGSGLGLAIAKRAVERSNGEIALESSVANGTRVRFRFARCDGQ
jgi:two-component system OmpR family sensor kinase